MVAIPQGLPGATEGPLRDLHAADHLIRRAVDVLERILHAVRVNGSFSISDAEEAAKNLLLSIEASDALLVAFFSAGTSSVNLAREAVNVCILSGKMGMELSYVPEKLRRVALAGFLSDVGLARVPAEILGKPGALTPDERAVVENHQRECAKLFQARGPEYTWLAEVFERRYKRTTGPRGPDTELDEYAAIIRLADIYESLVHHRPFRQRLATLEALGEILRRDRPSFSDRILRVLIRILSTFPVGSLVRLNTGDIARVAVKNKDFPFRPVVEVLVRHGERLREPVVIDLSQSPLHHIQDAVTEEALSESGPSGYPAGG